MVLKPFSKLVLEEFLQKKTFFLVEDEVDAIEQKPFDPLIVVLKMAFDLLRVHSQRWDDASRSPENHT